MRLVHIFAFTFVSADPTKPPQQRLNVQFTTDSSSRNTLGGPSSIVHKHSKAAAFSIFRSYGILGHRSAEGLQSQAAGPHGSLPTSSSVLLALKRVQEQYTSTKSTKLLSTHGLLEEKKGDENKTKERALDSRRHAQTLPITPSGPIVPRIGQQIIPRGAAASKLTRPSTSSSVADSQAASTSGHSSFDVTRTTESATSHASTEAISRTTPEAQLSLTHAASSTTHADSSDSDSDDLNAQVATRTSHAEAFATLDRESLEQYRTRHLHLAETPPSVTGWLKRLRGPLSATRSAQPNFNPPWMTLAPRTTQEQQELVIQNLNESFKDVGLLPSYRKKGGTGSGRKGRSKAGDVLAQVPEDSLYMLLPLWPRETDPVSTNVEPVGDRYYLPPIEERLYLLVYYVPFADRSGGTGGGGGSSGKKRSRSVTRRGEPGHSPHLSSRSVVLTAFRAIARLVTYVDLRGSGVRLPSRGMAVSGPLAAAVRGIPSASLRDVHHGEYVIAVCQKRDHGVEIVPEGLEKLGLCEPRTQATVFAGAGGVAHPAMQVRDPDMDAMNADPQPLTAIGRAAVEMVWLGCMAVTSFQGY